MSPEARALLTLLNLPAVLSAEEASWLLGFRPHEIKILTRKGHLKCLGKPRRGSKRYATSYLLELKSDVAWLSRGTDVLAQHWRINNEAKHPSSDTDI